MASKRQLPRIVTIWPGVTAKIDAWRRAIERCDSWSWGEGFHVRDGEAGRTVSYLPPPSAVSAVVASGGITAAVASTLGQGDAVLWPRIGAALTDGPSVKVYSNFSTAIPAGTRIEVAPDGADYKLIGADCPV